MAPVRLTTLPLATLATRPGTPKLPSEIGRRRVQVPRAIVSELHRGDSLMTSASRCIRAPRAKRWSPPGDSASPFVSEAMMFGPSTDVPALSLVIPVYNAADQLSTTLESVDQFVTSYPARVEVLFVDDCSSEVDTQLILEDFATQRDYARVLRNAKNRGKGFSVARGMLAARGRHRV